MAQRSPPQRGRALIVEDEIFFALEQVELDQTNRKPPPV
jgi:hypothetical protein